MCFFVAAIEQEKGQQKLIAGIENFNPKSLKHTETKEKNPLPTKEGMCLILLLNNFDLRPCIKLYLFMSCFFFFFAAIAQEKGA